MGTATFAKTPNGTPFRGKTNFSFCVTKTQNPHLHITKAGIKCLLCQNSAITVRPAVGRRGAYPARLCRLLYVLIFVDFFYGKDEFGRGLVLGEHHSVGVFLVAKVEGIAGDVRHRDEVAHGE